MKYYECHITLQPDYKEFIEPIAVKHKFKTSVLKGDEIMGDDTLMYCTCHDKSFETISVRMDNLINDFQICDIPILRKKIEHVVLDERYT